MYFARCLRARVLSAANVECFTAARTSADYCIWWNAAMSRRHPLHIAAAQYFVLVLCNFLTAERYIRHLFARQHFGWQLVTVVEGPTNINRRSVAVVASMNGSFWQWTVRCCLLPWRCKYTNLNLINICNLTAHLHCYLHRCCPMSTSYCSKRCSEPLNGMYKHPWDRWILPGVILPWKWARPMYNGSPFDWFPADTAPAGTWPLLECTHVKPLPESI